MAAPIDAERSLAHSHLQRTTTSSSTFGLIALRSKPAALLAVYGSLPRGTTSFAPSPYQPPTSTYCCTYRNLHCTTHSLCTRADGACDEQAYVAAATSSFGCSRMRNTARAVRGRLMRKWARTYARSRSLSSSR
ncbi:hypothetical protein BKA93DRAFT_119414 [Sparassis latifolia]